MPEIKPFKGLLFNTEKVRIEDTVTPPFDVISAADRSRYELQSEYNMVYLSLDTNYERVAERFSRWIADGILIQSDFPAIYVYRQTFNINGEDLSRLGFICRLRITDGDEVMPHENTFEWTKQDRLRLIQHVKANLSPVFMVLDDPNRQIDNLLQETVEMFEPDLRFNFEDVFQELWSISDERFIETICSLVRDRRAFIADGHHRYESSRIYRNMMREEFPDAGPDASFNFVMTYFVSVFDDGMVVLPTHRFVQTGKPDEIWEKIESSFEVEQVADLDSMFAIMNDITSQSDLPAIGMSTGDRFFILSLKDKSLLDQSIPTILRDLDVTILHSLIIPDDVDVSFIRDPHEVIEQIRRPDCTCGFGFFLNPIPTEKVEAVALSGHKMPHKSTYFYPKLLSGLVINKH